MTGAKRTAIAAACCLTSALACTEIPSAVVSGTLVGHDRKPIPVAHVHAFEASAEQPFLSVAVQEDGSYELTTAETGGLMIRFTGVGHDTGLASRCCSRILLRFVYHEFTDPAGMNASLLRALQPGGLIAVVDVLADGENLKNGRGEHAIVPDAVIQEMVDAGFELVSKTMDYDGHSNRFAVVLRRPN